MEKSKATKSKKELLIKGFFITLGQLLKLADLIDSGGQAKEYLKENDIKVNGVDEYRRGRKIYSGDEVSFNGEVFKIVVNDHNQS